MQIKRNEDRFRCKRPIENKTKMTTLLTSNIPFKSNGNYNNRKVRYRPYVLLHGESNTTRHDITRHPLYSVKFQVTGQSTFPRLSVRVDLFVIESL